MSLIKVIYRLAHSINTEYCQLDFRGCRPERRTDPCPGCSPQTPRTSRRRTALHFWWSGSCWCRRYRRIPWKKFVAPSSAQFITNVFFLELLSKTAFHLSSSSMSSPSLSQATSGGGSPLISAFSTAVVPLLALRLSGPLETLAGTVRTWCKHSINYTSNTGYWLKDKDVWDRYLKPEQTLVWSHF